MKKPRSDSKLANLPEETQAEIATWCKEGLEVARNLLKAKKGISISLGSLSSWLAWHTQQQELRIGNAGVVAILDWFKSNKPDASQAEIRTSLLMGLSLKAQARDDMDAALNVLKEQGRDLDRTLAARKVAMQEARTKAASAVQEAGKRLEVTPSVLKEILAAVDKRLMGEA